MRLADRLPALGAPYSVRPDGVIYAAEVLDRDDRPVLRIDVDGAPGLRITGPQAMALALQIAQLVALLFTRLASLPASPDVPAVDGPGGKTSTPAGSREDPHPNPTDIPTMPSTPAAPDPSGEAAAFGEESP